MKGMAIFLFAPFRRKKVLKAYLAFWIKHSIRLRYFIDNQSTQSITPSISTVHNYSKRYRWLAFSTIMKVLNCISNQSELFGIATIKLSRLFIKAPNFVFYILLNLLFISFLRSYLFQFFFHLFMTFHSSTLNYNVTFNQFAILWNIINQILHDLLNGFP